VAGAATRADRWDILLYIHHDSSDSTLADRLSATAQHQARHRLDAEQVDHQEEGLAAAAGSVEALRVTTALPHAISAADQTTLRATARLRP